MINFQKKQVKIISLIIALIFLFSIGALAFMQYQAASGMTNNSNVGIINYQEAMQASPSMKPLQEKYQKRVMDINQELETKTKGMNPQQQQEFVMKKQAELTQEFNPQFEAIKASVEKNVQQVANDRGLAIVLEKQNVLYGGQDITQEVIKKLQADGDVTPEKDSSSK